MKICGGEEGRTNEYINSQEILAHNAIRGIP
jgi:hypothetical protein